MKRDFFKIPNETHRVKNIAINMLVVMVVIQFIVIISLLDK